MTASTYFSARSSILDRAARRLGLALLSWSHQRQIRATVSREEQSRQFALARELEARQHAHARRITRLF